MVCVTSVFLHLEARIAVGGCTAPEIDDKGIEGVIDHNVMRFEISVKHALGSEEAHALRHLVSQREPFLKRECLASFDDEVQIVEVRPHVNKVLLVPVLPSLDFEVVLGDVARLTITHVVEKAEFVHERVDR